MRRKSVFLMVFLIVLVAGSFAVVGVPRVEASGTVYIRVDGSIDPPTAPVATSDNITYLLYDNVSQVIVERDDIVVDGGLYWVGGLSMESALVLSGRSNVTIENTQIWTLGTFVVGIYLAEPGIDIRNSIDIRLVGNDFANNVFAANIVGSNDTVISGNDMFIDETYRAFFDTSQWLGISMQYTSGSVISGNNITGCGFGIDLFSSSGNLIFHNNLLNNTQQVNSNNSTNTWDNGSQGNYWSDYNGTDANQDGIGDTPNVIDANNTDYYPLMNPYESGTVYIRADGSIDPPYAPISTFDNVTYTLTGNIISEADGIVVERNNIVVDGSGFTVEGVLKLSSHGVYLNRRRNVTIQNTNINNFNCGILLDRSSYSSIRGNTITNNNWDGVSLEASSCISISGNIITNNSGYGIWLYGSSINSIGGNTITNNGYGIELDYISNYNNISGNSVTNNNYGILLEYNSNNSISRNTVTNSSISGVLLGFSSNNNVSGNTLTDCSFSVWGSCANSVKNNTINGKPLVYLEGVADYSVDEAGGVVLVRCTGIRVENLNLSSGVTLWETNSSIVSGNAMSNNSDGIYLGGSSNNNSISGNNIIINSECGIRLSDSANNSINRNNITNNSGDGIWLSSSSDNRIDGNNITDSGIGICLYGSSNNSIDGNTIANSNRGISFRRTSGNTFCHNNFTNNTVQVNDCWEPEQANFWDNGCEGNYWSDYNGTDLDPDGIGDAPVVIDANNVDNYPLMGMFSEFDWVSLAAPEQRIQTICNSTISDLVYNGTGISFNVTGEDGTAGFCRIRIPTILLNVTYKVFVNGTEVTYRLLPFSNETYTYLYFNYTHSTQEVIVIPEFPSFLILPLILAATLLAVITYRRKRR